MMTLLNDLRWGLRMFRKSPGLTLTAVVTLALGIAAATIVFDWVDGILLDPIPGVPRSGELATLETVTPAGVLQNTAYRDYRDYRDGLRQVSGLAASLANVFTVGDDQNSRLLWGEFVSANYFSVMGVKPTRGRAFLPEESGDLPGGPPVVVISDHLWESAFQRDPRAVGRTLRVNQRELTVLGVTPPEFRGTVPGLTLEMWVPVALAPEMNGQGPWLIENRGARHMWITGRLPAGIAIERARAEVAALARRLAEAYPETNRGYSATLLPVWRGHLGAQQSLRTPLQILMAVCFLLLLIVGANVANLQLTRSAVRRKEFGIRLALGARPIRLVRQLLTESLLLSAAGAAAGALLALWGRPALVWLLPSTNLPIDFGSKSNWHMLAFVSLLSVGGAVLTGVAPALQAVHTGLNETLKESSRGSTSSAGARRTRSLLVIAEVALAMVALVGTGVLVRSFYQARSLDPGMDTRNVACAKYYVETFCHTSAERRDFCLRAAARLRSAPGVVGVSYSNFIPLEFGEGSNSSIEIEGYAPPAGQTLQTFNSSVSPGYFDVLGIPLIEGRDFREQDDRNTAPVIIVNESFARRFFGAHGALGRKVRSQGRWSTVVGLVRDSKYVRLTESPTPYFYNAYRQVSGGEFWTAFFVRTAGPVRGAVAALGRESAAVNAATRGSDFIPYGAWIGAALYPQRVSATLVGVVGTISLVLSAVGLYAVLAFNVSQRSNEFGIRIALGAGPRQLLLEVIRRGMVLTMAGVCAGTLAAIALLELASAYVPKLSANDPLILAASIVVLAAVGLLASYLPARRATMVDPAMALRRE